jgi:23S rRNA pseudouridine2605 synthase
VVVDGRPAVPGDRLTGQEKVFVDGNRIRLGPNRPRAEAGVDVLLYHKPAGEISARRDPEGRKSAFDTLPRSPRGRWIEVDRLDINASGLQLFTTDGDLANQLAHAGHRIEQLYAVRVRGTLSQRQVDALTETGQHEPDQAGIESMTAVGSGKSNNWYEVRLRGGGKRDLRRSFDEVDAPVNRLIRIGYGPLELGKLPRGKHQLLDDGERNKLLLAAKDANRTRR